MSRIDEKPSARIALASLTALLALGCENEKEASLIERVPVAAECGLPIDGGVELEGDEELLVLRAECGEGDPCEPDTPYVQGSALLVTSSLGMLRNDRFYADLLVPEVTRVQNLSLLRDPCNDEPWVLALLFLDAPGELTLQFADAEGLLDTFRLRAAPVDVVEVTPADDAAEGPLDALELTLGEDARQLHATPRDADGTALNALEQVAWWIDDPAIAALDALGAPNAEGVTVTLVPRAEGETTLHVLVANVETELPVRVLPE